jgi:hypothetical protein
VLFWGKKVENRKRGRKIYVSCYLHSLKDKERVEKIEESMVLRLRKKGRG